MVELGVRCGSEGDAEKDEGLLFGAEEGDDDFPVTRYEVVERKRWKWGREERWLGIFLWWGVKFLKIGCIGGIDVDRKV